MRMRWLILTTLIGGLVAAIVWTWPASPIWRSGRDAGRLEGFTRDGKAFITTVVPERVNNNYPNPELRRWDSESGALLARVEFPCNDPQCLKAIRPSTDGRMALIGEGWPPDASRADFGTGNWFLHDAISGLRQFGPIPSIALVPAGAFSSDGRWFLGIRGEPRGGFQSLRGQAVFSAQTGKLVLSLPDRDDLIAGECLFSPDGNTLAVSWGPRDREKSNSLRRIEVLDLPSGRVQYRFDLRLQSWVRMERWDGRYLQAVRSVPEGSSGLARWNIQVFDALRDPVGEGAEDPLLYGYVGRGFRTSYWLDCPESVAYIQMLPPLGPPTRIQLCKDWLATRIGMHRPPTTGILVTARFVDRPTGAARYEIPFGLRHPCFMSPDGRQLACSTDREGIEFWDTDPSPKWPIALAAGAATAVAVLLLGWGLRRRAQVRHALLNRA